MRLAKLEKYLQQRIFPDLERGRPQFDKPHTQTVVHYLKKIIKNSPGVDFDQPVLITAAYAHDWGYTDLYNNQQIRLSEIKTQKDRHQQVGKQKIAKLLQDSFFSFLTAKQKERIVHLVAIHDQSEQLKSRDELTLMEADVMGALDTDLVTPTFSPKDNERFLNGIGTKKVPLFVNQYSRKKVAKLIQKRRIFYQDKNLDYNPIELVF